MVDTRGQATQAACTRKHTDAGDRVEAGPNGGRRSFQGRRQKYFPEAYQSVALQSSPRLRDELAQVRDGRAINIGGIRANSQGELVYTLGDGVEHKYRRLAELGEEVETAAI